MVKFKDTNQREEHMSKKPALIILSALVMPLMLSAWSSREYWSYNDSKDTRTGVTTPDMNPPKVNEVTRPNGAVDDFATLSAVQNAIKSLSKSYNINIRILDGNVTLTGEVGSSAEKQNIEGAVKRIPGVKKVTNQLTISEVVKNPNGI